MANNCGTRYRPGHLWASTSRSIGPDMPRKTFPTAAHAIALLLACALLALPTAASAAQTNALPDAYVANGSVSAIAMDSQGRAYIGGTFDHVGPRYGGLLSLTTGSGAADPSFADVAGPVF